MQLNLGLHGAGLSVGRRGLHIGMNRFGEYRKAGIPETSLYAVYFRTDDDEHHVRGGIPVFGTSILPGGDSGKVPPCGA